MINHAYSNIPYYQKLFRKNGLEPNDIQTPQDLLSIPPLTKEIIKNNFEKLTYKKRIRTSFRTTSGSTAKPLKFLKDRNATACMDAIEYKGYSWHDITIGSPQARFWSLPTVFNSKIKSRATDLVMNRIRLNALNITIKEMEKFYYKKQIMLIEEVFKTKYVNEYGCTETGLIGLNCKKGSLHLMAHNIYLECVKNGKQVMDESGEFFITELNAITFPFIRYKIGDRGIISTKRCNCGINLPIIQNILGRTVDNLKTASGRKINDSIFEYLMKDSIDDCVESFKAIQTKIDKVEIFLVVNEKFKDESIKNYIKALEKHSFGEIIFDVIKVSQLPRENSGKNRVFVSRIN
jgi:phenylacetate-CoA ligase